MQLLKHGVLGFCLIALMGTACAEGLPTGPLPVAYTIDARLDTVHKTLDATEVLHYRNLTGKPQDRFPFHLYLNGFQPTSTFMQEVRRDNPRFMWDDKWYGAIEVKSLIVSGAGDLTAQMRYTHPDDDNPYDRTVFEVHLPKAVPPGGEVEFRITFHDQFPEVFARTGYKRDFFMGAQWFPKLGAWWKNGWNCHQFHENTEFFSDFGTYDVKLTLPQRFVVGSSGVQVDSTNNTDGTKTVRLHGDVIHDFAWSASPAFEVVTDKFTGSSGAVNIRLLMERSRLGQAQRYVQALKGAMERFDKWYGPYPYPQITVIDPPHGAARAGGMEYPSLITGFTAWWMPKGLRFPELVVAHELGHQYWYGMVATNEFEEAWLDEGINSYSEVKVMSSLYGADTAIQLGGATLGDAEYERLEYIQHADTDPLVRPGWMFVSSSAYSGVTYGKTASVLLALEKLVGEATVQRALRVYFLRYRFTHPTREDFLNTLQEVSGEDLHWYIDQAVYGTAVLDYEIASVNSDRPDWARSKATAQQEKSGEIYYTSNVVVHRKGDFIFPVDVLVKFSNGSSAREHWDGRDRWIRYTYRGDYKVNSAQVDPTHELWLDKDFYNNSRTREVNPRAKYKLANYWMFLTQLFSQLLAWLV